MYKILKTTRIRIIGKYSIPKATVNCTQEIITMDIEYPGFNNNWFGIVFNDEMIGDALVYTKGKNASNRTQALYYYL